MDSGTDLSFGGDRSRAETLYREAIETGRDSGDERVIGYALNCYGYLLSEDAGRAAEAIDALDEALELLNRIGDQWGAACTAGSLGVLRLYGGDMADAAGLFREELTKAQGFESLDPIVEALQGLAVVAARNDDPSRATRLFGHADRIVRETGVGHSTTLETSSERDAAQAALGDDTYEALSAEGAALTLAEAVAYALADG